MMTALGMSCRGYAAIAMTGWLFLAPAAVLGQTAPSAPYSLRAATWSEPRRQASDGRGTRRSGRQQPSPTERQRSIARKTVGVVIGAVAGCYLGGHLGAALEGKRCRCDDPGLVGWKIGAPVGAILGALLGSRVE
jgi:hypothetical protein